MLKILQPGSVCRVDPLKDFWGRWKLILFFFKKSTLSFFSAFQEGCLASNSLHSLGGQKWSCLCYTQRILNKCWLSFSVGCMVLPWCCLLQPLTTRKTINKIAEWIKAVHKWRKQFFWIFDSFYTDLLQILIHFWSLPFFGCQCLGFDFFLHCLPPNKRTGNLKNQQLILTPQKATESQKIWTEYVHHLGVTFFLGTLIYLMVVVKFSDLFKQW